MKNSIFVLILGLVLLTGCQTEETMPLPLGMEDLKVTESSNSVYVVNLNQNTPTYEMVALPDNSSATPATREHMTKGGNPTAFGQFGTGATTSIKFTGTHDQRQDVGLYGYADFQQQLPFGKAHLYMNAQCLDINGSEAVYGGEITQVLSNPFPPNSGPFQVGNILYFKVKDATPMDQYSPTLIIAPVSLCGIIGPNHPLWTPLVNVAGSKDRITVSN